MHSFFSIAQEHIHIDDILILAVSGWVDSMVLLDLIRQRHPIEKMIVVHFDHMLRWDESDWDRDLVANICNNHNIRFEYKKMDIRSMANDEKMNIEAIARRERYLYFETVRKQYGAKYILTAHHAGDQTETVIGNMIKWAKIRWLSGMLLQTWYIFRPLISTTKKWILEYARENSVEYRNDSTNEDVAYDRNRIRRDIVPVLEALNPDIHMTIGELAEYMQELGVCLSRQVELWLEKSEKETGKLDTFLSSSFIEESLFFQSEIISYLYARAQGGSTQWLSRWLIDELIRFISDPGSYGKKEIKNLKLERRGKRILILI